MASGLGLVRDAGDDRSDPLRNDFIANVGHELKTPVGALSLLAETMALEDDPDVLRRLADRVLDESERIARMIDDLLSFAEDEFETRRTAGHVAIDDVVAAAVERVRHTAHAKDIALDVGVVPPVVVRGSLRQLASALGNLLENGVKYSPEHARVELDVSEGEGFVAFAIRDYGPGIPIAEMGRIFDRFYRGEGARTVPGNGLGLAIVRQVAASHGGEIRVRPAQGGGSLFTLRLPVA